MYYGSMWKDYTVWQAAPWIAHRLGARTRYAVEYDNVSCGTPVALRLARDMLLAEDELRNVLVVAACRESYLLDYANERSRFMFNFGDGAVAGLLAKGAPNALLGCYGLTDGSFSLQVKVNSGGSVDYLGGERYLDVTDPAVDEGGARRGQPAELRRGGGGRARARRARRSRRRLPLRDPHEALDARRACSARSGSRPTAPPTSTTRAT